jgi:hypothetical protein
VQCGFIIIIIIFLCVVLISLVGFCDWRHMLPNYDFIRQISNFF